MPEIPLPAREWLAQPVVVLGKIKLAGTAGNGAAVLDCVQELAVLDRLQESGTDVPDLIAAGHKIVHQRVETASVDAGLAFESLESAELMIEFLENLATDVAPGENRQYLEQRRNRGPRGPIGVFVNVGVGVGEGSSVR